ncbi:hypothetical protein DH2020_034792 [Rehmannia glutinosa]|uniref:Uncharacterized protein n=1 Tax=Rehmannia glutinosa TaxID=99300 RepID=A0ABR0V8W7_REHGL
MEMEIISSEKIKPFSPTPDHLKLYKISLLDQIIPPVFAPAVLYFAPDNSNSISQKIQILKDSLALTLSHFYPFAGVIKDALSVDCNDDGLPFLVTKVKGQISNFLKSPDMQLINKLLPSEFSWSEGAGPGANVGIIQLNYFECGGMAICVILAHHITDATTLCTFLKSWSANARGCAEIVCPNYISQSVFPQKVAMQKESHLFYSLQQFLKVGKFVTKRYVFDASAISTLKSQSNSDEHLTRVEIVSAFIWKCFILAVGKEKSGNGEKKPFLLTQPVNLRRRADPNFPEGCFGNFIWLAAAKWTINSTDMELKELVNEVKRAMSKIDKEFVKKLQGENGYYENFEMFKKGIPEEANWFALSSWSKIGLYDVDFGWGRPVWLSGFVSGDLESVLPNSATLMETRSGDGIEAWVILDEKYVAGFEENEELKNYACFNPSAW